MMANLRNFDNMIGKEVEDFVLKDHNGKPFTLAQYRGKRVLLSFHPLAFTPVCEEQMKSLEKNYEEFEALDTIPVGISVDSTFSKHAWAKIIGINKLRMLSDFWPHGGVAQKFGVFDGEAGFSKRANIIIGKDGRIEFMKVYEISELPDVNELIEFLRVE